MRHLRAGKTFAGLVFIVLLWTPAFGQDELLISADEAFQIAQLAALDEDRLYAAGGVWGEKAPTKEAEAQEEEALDEGIPDPLEPWNRAMFAFNDWFYFSLFKPVAKGYTVVMPDVARAGLRNFFDNLFMPVRFINALLQAKPKQAGIELSRFIVNSSVGFAGFVDIATKDGLVTDNEDFGQTLGVWGIGHGFYLVWPLIGPSSLRDSVGLAGDYFAHPLSYLNQVTHWAVQTGVRALEYTNEGSFRIGDYEDLKEAAIDPYIALRDAYYQRRKAEVER